MGWYGPGDRQTAFLFLDRALDGSSSRGSRRRSARSVHRRTRTGAARSRPGGRRGPRPEPRTSSRACHRRAVRASGRTRSRPSHARAGRGLRASGWARSWIRLLQMRLGLDAFDDPLDRQIAHRSAERGDPSGLEREQAYRSVSERRDQRRERLVLGQRCLHAAPPMTRNTGAPTGNPAAARCSRSRARNRSGFPRTSAWTAGSDGCELCTIARPAGRAQPTASIQMASARSRAARPGRRAAESASSTRRDQGARRRDRGRARGRRRATSPADLGSRGGTASRPAPTRSAPPIPRRARRRPRRIPKVVPPQTAQRRWQRRRCTAPVPPRRGAARRTTHRRPGGRRCGRPARRRSRGSARRRRPAGRSGEPATRRGARPSGPGRTTSTTAIAVRAASRPGCRVPRPLPTGRAAASTQVRRRQPGPLERDVANVVIRSAVLAMRGVGLTRHEDQADVPSGANTAGRVPTTTSYRPSRTASQSR